MAILKSKKSRVLGRGCSSGSEDDEGNGCFDSGAGSDDSNDDLEALDEIGSEFCQVGDHNCWIPFELYDLPYLGLVLSTETWDNCLTEEERFGLCEFLPDMDQETFRLTLKELFSGKNFHFGSPIVSFFEQLKGGLCDPRVALYRKGLNLFEKKQHYHLLRKYHDSMVGKLLQMQEDCMSYVIRRKRPGSRSVRMLEPEIYRKRSPKGILKVKAPWKVNAGPNRLVSSLQSRLPVPMSSRSQKDQLVGYEVENWGRLGNRLKLMDDKSEAEHEYTMAGQRDQMIKQEHGFGMDCLDGFDDWEFGRSKKWKIGEDHRTFETNGGLNLRNRSKINAGISMSTQSDDTESDSLGWISEEAGFGQQRDFRVYSSKRKKEKSNVNHWIGLNEPNHLHGYGGEIWEGNNSATSANFVDDHKRTSKSGKNGKRYLGENLHLPVHQKCSLERKQKNGIDLKFSGGTW